MPTPLEVFGLPNTALPCEVRDLYKERAKTAHPDAGGTVEEFQALRDAFNKALAYAMQPRTCARCKGAKQVRQGQRGFVVLWAKCPDCKGVGTVKNS